MPVRDIANTRNRASAPAARAQAVSLEDVFPFLGATLYVGSGGDVAVIPAGQEEPVVLKNVPAGTFIPIMVKAVVEEDTTASDIVALF